LWTAHGEIEWEALFMTLRKRGKIVVIGFAEMGFNPTDLAAHELSITGSFLGNLATMQEMLSFAQEHGIKPQIEL
jgi:D-arabinose 1-dehydrogenase-like Zn-dependent alcohol dehydrogenase